MAHQLYVLQTDFLGLLEQRMNSKMDPQDQESHDKIKVTESSLGMFSVFQKYSLFCHLRSFEKSLLKLKPTEILKD